MGHKPRVRPGLSSPDQSQDVEFTLDQQIDEGQHERDENEGGGALGPPSNEERFKSDRQPPTGDEKQEIPDLEKKPRRSIP